LSDWGGAGGFGFLRLRSGQALRLRDCKDAIAPLRMTDWWGTGGKQVPRFARNDRKKGKGKGRSRFLAPLGMTEREARATARAEAGSSLPPQQAKNAWRGPRLRSEWKARKATARPQANETVA